MASEVIIPRLGWSMEEGIFTGWLFAPGDLVRRGQALFTLEGEKATQDIEAIDGGVLHIAPDAPRTGQVVAVGKLIGMLCGPNELPVWNNLAPTSQHDQSSNKSILTKPVAVAAPPSVRRLARKMGIDLNAIQPSWPGGRIGLHDLESDSITKSIKPTIAKTQSALITPRARRYASQNNVDCNDLIGTGRNGRIRERDVINHVGGVNVSSSGVKVATSGLRRAIARNMVNSRMQTVPVTLTTKADASSLLAFRNSLKQQNGILAPTINDILLLLMAKALVLHPNLAAQWHESHIILPHQDGFHLGLAVDSALGLVVPVIRNVPQLPLEVLAEQTRMLIKKARENNLQQSEISGGIFTLTNLGNFGIDHFNPVINFPECSIMGIGLIRQEAVPDTNGNVVFRSMLPLSLTFDHRIVDGAPAARFLQSVVTSIEEFGKS